MRFFWVWLIEKLFLTSDNPTELNSINQPMQLNHSHRPASLNRFLQNADGKWSSIRRLTEMLCIHGAWPVLPLFSFSFLRLCCGADMRKEEWLGGIIKLCMSECEGVSASLTLFCLLLFVLLLLCITSQFTFVFYLDLSSIPTPNPSTHPFIHFTRLDVSRDSQWP